VLGAKGAGRALGDGNNGAQLVDAGLANKRAGEGEGRGGWRADGLEVTRAGSATCHGIVEGQAAGQKVGCSSSECGNCSRDVRVPEWHWRMTRTSPKPLSRWALLLLLTSMMRLPMACTTAPSTSPAARPSAACRGQDNSPDF